MAQWLNQAQSRLMAAGVDSVVLDTRMIAESILGRSRSWLLAHPEQTLTPAQIKRLNQFLKLRLARRPLAYILGDKEFYGLKFDLSPDVLIPRPETENMIEEVSRRAKPYKKVLDMGTGSGCVAIALKYDRPDLVVTATDVSAPALKIARANARRLGTDITFVLSDLFAGVQGRYDWVLANLPYVPDGARRQLELEYEPALALYGGADGLDYYRQFFTEVDDYLSPSGQVVIEAGPTQRAELVKLAGTAGFKLISSSEYISWLIRL